jgi:hypothetical protein
MKLPFVGWAFFALAVALAAWHVLSIGVLVGSEIREIQRPYGAAFIHVCKYLYINGIRTLPYPQIVLESHAQGENAFCPPTPPNNSN